MAVYNSKIADIETSTGASKVEKTSTGFREIQDIDMTSLSEQTQVLARNTRTSTTRGTQTVRGKFEIQDNTGNVVMVMGYDEGGF